MTTDARTVRAGPSQPNRLHEFVQDPSEDLDYTVDWDATLAAGEEVAESEWEVSPEDGAPTVHDDGSDERTTEAFLAGGTDGETYVVTNRIVTDATPPRTHERSFRVLVRSTF